MSRLDEIRARYGWCERCANHDPRDRRDHGHLRSQTEIDALWLVEQVESLERWKVEAIEVMSGLRELGRALGLGLGVQITGPAALAEVERLTAERDALAAQVARVEEVLDHWRTVDEGNAAYAERIGERSRFADGLASRADMLRAALADPEADTSDTQPTDQEVSDE